MTTPISDVAHTLKTARSSKVAVLAPTMLIPFKCPHEAIWSVVGAGGSVKRRPEASDRGRRRPRRTLPAEIAAEFGRRPRPGVDAGATMPSRPARYYEALGVPCGGGAGS